MQRSFNYNNNISQLIFHCKFPSSTFISLIYVKLICNSLNFISCFRNICRLRLATNQMTRMGSFDWRCLVELLILFLQHEPIENFLLPSNKAGLTNTKRSFILLLLLLFSLLNHHQHLYIYIFSKIIFLFPKIFYQKRKKK